MDETIISYISLITSIITLLLLFYVIYRINKLDNANNDYSNTQPNEDNKNKESLDERITTFQNKLKGPSKTLIATTAVGALLIPPMTLAVDRYDLTNNQYFNITILLLTLPILFYAFYILGISQKFRLGLSLIVPTLYLAMFFYDGSYNDSTASTLVIVTGYAISYLIVKVSVSLFNWLNVSLSLKKPDLQNNFQALIKLLSLVLTAIILYELIKLGVKLG